MAGFAWYRIKIDAYPQGGKGEGLKKGQAHRAFYYLTQGLSDLFRTSINLGPNVSFASWSDF